MMHKDSLKDIVVIGAGSVATHLALALYSKGYKIRQIFNRTLETARNLAVNVQAAYCNDLGRIYQGADIYLIAISDQAIDEILSDLHLSSGILVHTSGTLEMDILKKSSENYGVFYPLQTFSKNKEVSFNTIPICIEASNDKVKAQLHRLASALTSDVREMSTSERRITHLAAVFACNFSNFMYVAAADILKSSNISFDILLPLIREYLDKVAVMDPWKAQTGPAYRQDYAIIDKHLQLLDQFPEYKEVYQQITQCIMDRKQRMVNNI